MTKDGSLAIVIFAYKRPDHLRVCLDSLAKNLEVKELPLHIFVDGPRNEESAKLTKKVIEVSESARGFLSINLHARKANFGLYKSLTEGITDLFEFYESLVVLEDDLEVSPYFLRYMIDGLALYKDCKEVASVHGYLPPISKECDLPDTFFLPGADCWGWATWRDRWSSFRRDPRNMAKEISSLNLTHEFNLLSNYNYFGMLEDKALKYNDSWAICWHATCYLAGQITLYPGRSLVKNIGLDLSGESCGSFEKKMMSSEFTDRAINIKFLCFRIQRYLIFIVITLSHLMHILILL